LKAFKPIGMFIPVELEITCTDCGHFPVAIGAEEPLADQLMMADYFRKSSIRCRRSKKKLTHMI